MRERAVLWLVFVASTGALAFALFVQHVLGYPPCSLCSLARVPHLTVIIGSGLALWRGWHRAGIALAGAAYVAAFTISLRHVGVEHGWLSLPDGCVVSTMSADLDSLRTALMAQTQPSCDQPGPRFAGVSMAQWHMMMSLTLSLAITLTLARRRR